MRKTAIVSQACGLWSAKKWFKNAFFHPSSPFSCNFCNCNSVAFVLLGNSRLNFHCEPTPTWKSAQKWQLQPFVTSGAEDYEGHSLLQTSSIEPPNKNQICWKVHKPRFFPQHTFLQLRSGKLYMDEKNQTCFSSLAAIADVINSNIVTVLVCC